MWNLFQIDSMINPKKLELLLKPLEAFEVSPPKNKKAKHKETNAWRGPLFSLPSGHGEMWLNPICCAWHLEARSDHLVVPPKNRNSTGSIASNVSAGGQQWGGIGGQLKSILQSPSFRVLGFLRHGCKMDSSCPWQGGGGGGFCRVHEPVLRLGVPH